MADDLIGREIALTGTYEAAGIAAMQWLCDAGVVKAPFATVFLDIGANVGVYSISMASRFAEVIAVEPHPIISRALELNAETNSISNFSMARVGLSDRDGSASLYEGNPGNVGMSSLERRDASSKEYRVELRRGDLVVRELTTRPVSLVKIDVEGHETSVIAGLEDTLRQNMPVVAFEANDMHVNKHVPEMLADLGYSYFLALDWAPRVRWMWLRVALFTFTGAVSTLREVTQLTGAKYPLVFVLSPDAKVRFEKMSSSHG